jgi:subtilisin family serine protease
MTAVSAKDNGKEEKVRVIAHSNKEVSDALSQGCRVVREAKTLKALECSRNAASSLGLQEDIRVFSMDTAANTQIRADLVQSAGNTGAGRKVVILDTGYNYSHPELSSSYLGGKDFVNNDDDPMDDNGHGSHVAGIITADGVSPSAKGVAPGTGIIAGKVLDAFGSGYFSDVVEAIYWAVDGPDGIPNTADDFNADAISLSLGTSPPYTYSGFCNNALPDMTNATKYAVDRGVVVVVAAGNSGRSGVSIPGCINYSTTVGAVDSSDRIASFSGIGNAVDITAPGVNILSAWGSGYAYASGTSMATPVVSGTVALIKSAHPTYTVAQTQDALFKNAKDLGYIGKDSTYGWGRVDAYRAVSTTPPSPAGTMHVAGIVMSKVKGTRYTYATATVTIVDSTGSPVSSATVSGHWSGLTSDKDTGTTNASGKITVKSNQVRNSATGTFTFTVDNVTYGALVYNPADNVRTSNSISI